MAPKKCRGTPLKVFSGKEATLNRVIMLILAREALKAEYARIPLLTRQIYTFQKPMATVKKPSRILGSCFLPNHVLAMNKLSPIALASSARNPRSGTAATTSAASFMD